MYLIQSNRRTRYWFKFICFLPTYRAVQSQTIHYALYLSCWQEKDPFGEEFSKFFLS